MQRDFARGEEDRGDASRLLLIDENSLSLLDYLSTHLDDIFFHLPPSHALFVFLFFGIMQLLFYENKAHMYGREQP